MSQIEDVMDGLMTAIRNSEEFIRYQAIKEKVHGFPKLESQITEFRKKNYEIQNNEMLDNPYDEVNNLFMEYDSIVHDTIVNDFIRAEQKLVRMMKLVYEQIADDLDFDIIDEDAR